MFNSQRFPFGLSLLFVAYFASILTAQVDTGTILGVVRVSIGAIVPQARVTLLNEGTGSAQSTITNESGSYVFTPLRIGTYSVEVEHPGFQKQRKTGVPLNIQQQIVIDFSMVVGEVSSTVEVNTAIALLQTENGSVGQVVQTQSINDLPLNGRNYTFLARLTAGVDARPPAGRGLGGNPGGEAEGKRAVPDK